MEDEQMPIEPEVLHPDGGESPTAAEPGAAQAPVRQRASRIFQRAAPALRKVEAALEEHAATPQARQALAGKAAELVTKADEALRRVTAVEGTVVDVTASPVAPQPDTDPPPIRVTPLPPMGPREPHWSRRRVRRMAMAAAREAARPNEPVVWHRQPAVLVVLAASVLGLLLVVLRRR